MTPRFLALSAKWKVIWPVETENLGWGCWFKKAAWAQNDQLFSLIFYLKWQGTYFERNEIITKLEKRKEWYQWTRSSEEFLEYKELAAYKDRLCNSIPCLDLQWIRCGRDVNCLIMDCDQFENVSNSSSTLLFSSFLLCVTFWRSMFGLYCKAPAKTPVSPSQMFPEHG